MQDDLSQKSVSSKPVKPAEETITSQLLFELTLFSTTLFVFTTLLLRFLLNLQTALLLRIYSIHFQYRFIRYSFFNGGWHQMAGCWILLFLKASPRRVFFKDNEHQKLYIQNVFFKSWFGGFLILLVFNRPLVDGFWPVFLLSLGFIAMPLFNQRVVRKKLIISRSGKKILPSSYAVLLILVILALIWVAGNYRINF